MTDDSTDRAKTEELSPVEAVELLAERAYPDGEPGPEHAMVQAVIDVALAHARELERLRDRMTLLRALDAIKRGLPITEDECKRALAAVTRTGSEAKGG